MSEPQKRLHDWQDLPEDGSMWSSRRCNICHLVDMFPKNGLPRSKIGPGAWIAESSCIEPVADTLTYQALKAELVKHRVTEKPLVIGVPGKWKIGFCIYCRNGQITYPCIEVNAPETLEHGFAELLRWIRAREYNIEREPNFQYLQGLYGSSCACEGDD